MDDLNEITSNPDTDTKLGYIERLYHHFRSDTVPGSPCSTNCKVGAPGDRVAAAILVLAYVGIDMALLAMGRRWNV